MAQTIIFAITFAYTDKNRTVDFAATLMAFVVGVVLPFLIYYPGVNFAVRLK